MSRQLHAQSCVMHAAPSRRRPYNGAHVVAFADEALPVVRGRGRLMPARGSRQVPVGSMVVYNSNRRRAQPQAMPPLLRAEPSTGRSPSSRQRARQARRVYAGAFPWYDPLFSSQSQLTECQPFKEPSLRSEREMYKTIVSLTDLHRLCDVLLTIMHLRVADITDT
ncbi:hypothetical protein QAD02_007057 [Eretmocerus hayati]|uniref:Uncharacterized protein n=1 Tax=Eretmocerus hayati TaxID=131215 RepID=A0ACC2N2J7_9HYME|nr:hypothetical protein QAD02_007057 [Eretmocerus hayati]